jgi:hypothetical protein
VCSGGGSVDLRYARVGVLRDAVVAKLDSAAVQVDFVGKTHKGALLALSEGGYAVQVEGGGLIAVRIGMVAKGLVEITGAGLVDGTEVVTTS